MSNGDTLIDHELLTAPTKEGPLKRVAAFGWYAGAVGAGEALCLTGLALLKRGTATPLLASTSALYRDERVLMKSICLDLIPLGL